jgi:hypothetical protein
MQTTVRFETVRIFNNGPRIVAGHFPSEKDVSGYVGLGMAAKPRVILVLKRTVGRGIRAKFHFR